MPITMDCAHCRKKFRIPDRLAGKAVACPHCKTRVDAPPAMDEEVPEIDNIQVLDQPPGPTAKVAHLDKIPLSDTEHAPDDDIPEIHNIAVVEVEEESGGSYALDPADAKLDSPAGPRVASELGVLSLGRNAAPTRCLALAPDNRTAGNVDFVFTGISVDWKHLNIVLEIKNAHSDRVEHGLTVQLPTYLQEREVATAIHGILWYKGTHFNKPSDATLNECIARLDAQKPKGIVSVVGFDLSFSVQASKK